MLLDIDPKGLYTGGLEEDEPVPEDTVSGDAGVLPEEGRDLEGYDEYGAVGTVEPLRVEGSGSVKKLSVTIVGALIEKVTRLPEVILPDVGTPEVELLEPVSIDEGAEPVIGLLTVDEGEPDVVTAGIEPELELYIEYIEELKLPYTGGDEGPVPAGLPGVLLPAVMGSAGVELFALNPDVEGRAW